MAFLRAVYSIGTKRHPSGEAEWEWELVRNGEPLGARVRGGPFKFESNAGEAGAQVLKEFLTLLKQEQDAPPDPSSTAATGKLSS